MRSFLIWVSFSPLLPPKTRTRFPLEERKRKRKKDRKNEIEIWFGGDDGQQRIRLEDRPGGHVARLHRLFRLLFFLGTLFLRQRRHLRPRQRRRRRRLLFYHHHHSHRRHHPRHQQLQSSFRPGQRGKNKRRLQPPRLRPYDVVAAAAALYRPFSFSSFRVCVVM